MSSRRFSVEECVEMGLALSAHQPEELLPAAMSHAWELAELPPVSPIATKRLINAPHAEAISRARAGEDAAFAEKKSD